MVGVDFSSLVAQVVYLAEICGLTAAWRQGRLLMGGLGDGSPTISKMGGFATKGLH